MALIDSAIGDLIFGNISRYSSGIASGVHGLSPGARAKHSPGINLGGVSHQPLKEIGSPHGEKNIDTANKLILDVLRAS